MAETTHSDNGQNGREGGFTLIEMFVVLTVISILLGLAMVMFTMANRKASDKAAQSDARNALVTQKSVYADSQTFGDATRLQEEEGALEFEELPETGLPGDGPSVLGKVFVRVDNADDADSTNDVATLVAQSKSGTCFWLREAPTGTTFAKGDCTVNPDTLTWSPTKW